MKKNIMIKPASIVGLAFVLASCSSTEKPPLVYFPDMYYPVAYDPLMQAKDPYTNHENTVFTENDGATWLTSVEGTVAQNKDGVVPEGSSPKNQDEYNAMYAASLNITASPLDPKNVQKDLARGKDLFNKTCSACHGVSGDGQGTMVASGAYSGVPNYKDRQLTVGRVHFVLENGLNMMGSFAGQLTPGDRWRVAMYVMNEFKQNAPATTETSENTASK